MTPVSASAFRFLQALMHRSTAVKLDDGKERLVELRLGPLAQRESCASIEDLVDKLQVKPQLRLQQDVVDALTVNETFFFRERHVFEALREVVIPGVISDRGAEQQICLWSMACSSGQEPYSLAMTLREHFPQLLGWDVRLIASDVSHRILAAARDGSYGRGEVNRGLPAKLLLKHFQREGLRWRISEEIRRMVQFQLINLAGGWPSLPAMDVIFLRNVLIYLDITTQRSILERACNILRPNGYLFLGGCETLVLHDVPFEPVRIGKVIGYRRSVGQGKS